MVVWWILWYHLWYQGSLGQTYRESFSTPPDSSLLAEQAHDASLTIETKKAELTNNLIAGTAGGFVGTAINTPCTSSHPSPHCQHSAVAVPQKVVLQSNR